MTDATLPLSDVRPVRTVRVPSSLLAPGKGQYNCSMIDWKGRLLFVYRVGMERSKIHICELDWNNYVPKSAGHVLRLEHALSTHGHEDPRIFVWKGELHVSYSGLRLKRRSMRSRDMIAQVSILVARLDDSLKVVDIWLPEFADVRPVEKNWIFFEHEGELFSIYSIAPHSILHHVNKKAYLHSQTTTNHEWIGGHLRGGTQPLLINNKKWSFFHGALDLPNKTRIYSMGTYEFEPMPPFAVTRMSNAPMFLANPDECPPKFRNSVVFPCGMVRKNDMLVVSSGIHDKWCEITEWRIDDVDRVMTTLPVTG